MRGVSSGDEPGGGVGGVSSGDGGVRTGSGLWVAAGATVHLADLT